MNSEKIIGFVVLGAVLVILAVVGWSYQNQQAALSEISSFEDCAAAGYPIMESYPEQCQTPDGRTFARRIDEGRALLPAEGEPITVQGEMVCLPHRDQTGPQTLECAFGLLAEDGTYYALRDTDPTYQNVSQPMGVPVEVVGTFTAQNDTKYQSVGIIVVDSITQLTE